MKLSVIKKLTVSLLVLATLPAMADSPARFEGAWRSCSTFEKDHDSTFAGQTICTGYYLLQRNDKICGTWAYFATGMYEGRLQATAIDPTHAKLTKICGRPSSDMQTQCEGGLEKEAPVGWEDSQQTLELCHGRLLGAGEVCQAANTQQGYGRQALKPSKRKELLSQPWVQSCLAGSLSAPQ
jgi:hypothetical protein